MNKKTILVLNVKKIFCINAECTHKTFAERFTFFASKSRKTRRLEEEILHISFNQSSVSASKYIAHIGKSSICDLIKKRLK